MAAKMLTARLVETARTDKAQLDIPDRKVRGLSLRVTKTGTKAWAFRYTRKSDGRLRRVTLGQFPALSLEAARMKAQEAAIEVAHGGDPAGGVAARRVAATFAEIADEWLRRHAEQNKSPRAVADDRSMLSRHVLPVIGDMKAENIRRRDIALLCDAVTGKSDARLARRGEQRKLTHRPNRVFKLVRAICRWAVGRDLLTIDPTFGISAPIKRERGRERHLSPAEIRQLWTALERAPASRRFGQGVPRGQPIVPAGEISFTRATALAMMLSLATAQRIGEVTGMAQSELDLNDAAPVWTVPAKRSKNGQSNSVPLSRLAVRLIREAMQLAGDSEWIFPNPRGDGPIKPHAPTKALDRARPAIGLEDFRIHDLRRTAATRMAEMGIELHIISLILNHVSASKGNITLGRYVKHSPEKEKRAALSAWGDRLERIVAGNDAANVVPLRVAASSA